MPKESFKNIHVLHVAKWYPHVGDVQNGTFVQKHVFASALFAEAKVLAWLPGLEKTIVQEGIEKNIPTTRVFFGKKAGLFQKHVAFTNYIHRHYNQNKLPDILHLHVFSADLLLVAFWAKRHRIPMVISEHWSGYARGIFSGMPFTKKWAYKQLAKRAVILPVSRFLQESMSQAGLAGNYQVLPNVVEENNHQTEKHTNFTFLVVADLVDQIKNISGIIAAFEAVAKIHQTCQLHIVGGGPDAAWIADLINKSVSANRIKMFGRLANEDVKKELPKNHCLVLNSQIETFGVVVLEAHAAGVPVICTTCGGPEDWLEDGDISIFKNDTSALKDAMLQMLARGEKTYTFSKWKSCLPAQIASQLQDIYAAVLKTNLK